MCSAYFQIQMLKTEIWMFDELYFLSARVSYHQISTLTMVILMITAANVTFRSCAFNISFTFGGWMCRFARWSKMFYCRNGNLVLGFSLLVFLFFLLLALHEQSLAADVLTIQKCMRDVENWEMWMYNCI